MHTVDVMLALSSKTSQLISHISVPQMRNEGNKSTQHLKLLQKTQQVYKYGTLRIVAEIFFSKCKCHPSYWKGLIGSGTHFKVWTTMMLCLTVPSLLQLECDFGLFRKNLNSKQWVSRTVVQQATRRLNSWPVLLSVICPTFFFRALWPSHTWISGFIFGIWIWSFFLEARVLKVWLLAGGPNHWKAIYYEDSDLMSGLLHGWGHFHGILGSCWSKVGHLGSLTFKGMSCPWLLPALFLFPGCHKVSSFLCHMSSLSICSNSLQAQRNGASQQRTEVSETMLYDKSSFL